MISNLLCFIFGTLATLFVVSKVYIPAVIACCLCAAVMYVSHTKNDKSLQNKIIDKCAYIYILVNDEKISETLLPELRKEISKIMSEIAAQVGGVEASSYWIKKCIEMKKKVDERSE